MREKALVRKTLWRDKVPPPPNTEQGILNMKKKSKPIILYNMDYTVYGEYPSIVETAKSIGCSEKTIIRAFKTEKKLLKKRLIVKYK